MLKEIPPPSVAARLADESVRDGQILLCAATDIDKHGRYHRQWLAVTAERLLVVSEDEPPQLILSMPLADATEYRCRSVIGSGLLQARVDGMFVDLLRYSNRMADTFHKIARKMDRSLQGEPIRIDPDEEVDPRRCPTCGLMLEFVGDTCPRCVSKGAVLARMSLLLAGYRKLAAIVMLLLVAGIGLDLVGPQLTRYLVDHVLPGSAEASAQLRANSAGSHQALVMLLGVVAILAASQIFRMGVNIFNGLLAARVGTAITADMRSRLVRHLNRLSVAYYDRQQVGSLVGRVAYDTEALHGFVVQLTGGFLFQLLMVVGVGVMMFSMNAKLALFTLIPAPFVTAGSYLFWRRIYPRYYRFWDASSKQAGMLSGTLSGIRVVKAFNQEDRENERFTRASDLLRRSRLGVDEATSLFNPVMGLLFQLGGWIVWFIGGRNVLLDKMSLGSLIAFFGYLSMFYGPLTMLSQFTNWLTQFATQAHRIFEILDTPVEITDAASPLQIDQVQGQIRFDDVTFGYNRHTPVLRNVSFEIAPGEMIGIVGRSGSGKTTIVNLISRFYDVNEGSVKIDGVDVRRLATADVHRMVGVVLQEPFLFRGSLYQNLLYGLPQATPEQVIAASKAGHAHDFIVSRPQGYDTWVGERGAGLSGGERQRIGIARVLLTDPRILILDEATSSVDAESEVAIQAAFAELVHGRTTIAIAHRLSTLRNANRIMVIDNGKLAEEGSHTALLEKDGLYAHLVRIQGQTTMPSVDQLSVAAEADELPWSPGGPLPHPRSHHPRWLEPGFAHIHMGNLDALHVTVEGEGIYHGVYAVRCLPVHYPEEYLSLRYHSAGNRQVEVGLIRKLAGWPAEAQRLLRDALNKYYFVHTILAIEAMESLGGYIHMKVQTDLGPMDFMLRWQTDRAQDYGPGGKMLIDTEENRYLIPEVDALPIKQRNLFQRYIYW